jgi:tRNA wybutosine-synthesizing protein 2
MGFKENLKIALKGELEDDELDLLPRGYQLISNIIIIKLAPKLMEKKKLIAIKCMELVPKIRSVYLNSGKIKGTFRIPEKIEYLAGVNDPIIEHKEHGVIYKFDVTKIMFSKGNVNERKFLATLVKPHEIIVDMFAGIGYFSLPIAKHASPEKIYCIEINPIAFQFLVENIKLNHLEHIIVPINGDCKEEVIKLRQSNILADRVIMGVFPAPKGYIPEALSLVNEEGTIYHYEGVIEKSKYRDLFKEFEEVANLSNMSCSLINARFVKSYGPNLFHVVLDIKVMKNKLGFL